MSTQWELLKSPWNSEIETQVYFGVKKKKCWYLCTAFPQYAFFTYTEKSLCQLKGLAHSQCYAYQSIEHHHDDSKVKNRSHWTRGTMLSGPGHCNQYFSLLPMNLIILAPSAYGITLHVLLHAAIRAQPRWGTSEQASSRLNNLLLFCFVSSFIHRYKFGWLWNSCMRY